MAAAAAAGAINNEECLMTKYQMIALRNCHLLKGIPSHNNHLRGGGGRNPFSLQWHY